MSNGDVFAITRQLLETNPQAVEQALREDPWLREKLVELDKAAGLGELRRELGDKLFFLLREYFWLKQRSEGKVIDA